MSNLKIAALMLASAAGGALIWNALQDEPPTTAARVEKVNVYIPAPASSQAADTAMALAIPLGSASAALPPPAQLPGNELGRRLLDTKDVRAFVADALKQPEKGGAFYATLALRECAHLSNPSEVIGGVVARETTVTTDRMEKIGATVDRCAGLTEEDIGAMQAQALRLGKEGKDPVMAMQLQMQATRPGTPERTALLDAMFKGNAALASQNFVANRSLQESMSVAKDGTITYRFDGQTYTDVQDQRAIDAAARLSACTGSDYCALDAEMRAQCRGWSGTCFATREEYLRQTARLDDVTFDKAQRFAEQMRAAMARGDRAIFR